MCTIGALRFPGGGYALFKNKDFRRASFDDRIVLQPEVFGVAGLATWAGSDTANDEFSGFAIGANTSGLLCCDANVQTIPDGANYDDLVEIALENASDVPGAIAVIDAAVRHRPYHRANIVMIDEQSAAAIEIRGDHIYVDRSDGPIVRTNHHTVFGPTPDDDNTTTTQPRLDVAARAIGGIDSVDGVFGLLRTHAPGDASICVHGPPSTVYSYVVSHNPEGSTLSVIQGPPCKTDTPTVLEIPFGKAGTADAQAAFRRAYPSAGTGPIT